MAVKLPDQEKIFRAEQHAWAKKSKKTILDETKRNLRGRVLHTRTGRLIRSITSKLEKTGATTDGFSIGIGTRYGVGWEKGFFSPIRTIAPVRGIALRFISRQDGKPVFVRRPITIPARLYKARSFVGRSVKERKSEIEQDYRRMMERIFKRSFPDLTITIDLVF